MFHQETTHIVTAVWGRTFILESEEWLQFFHEYVKVDILCEGLSIKETWADHPILHETTRCVLFWITTNVFMRRMWVLSTTRINIMAFNMP